MAEQSCIKVESDKHQVYKILRCGKKVIPHTSLKVPSNTQKIYREEEVSQQKLNN